MQGESEAEFYIAINADKLHEGAGLQGTIETLKVGFNDLHLTRIFLKVRKKHPGHELYLKAGFRDTRELAEDVNGVRTDFDQMEISSQRYAEMHNTQNAGI
jgi:hypothetical protein